jgi:PncC family amidohydrolase
MTAIAKIPDEVLSVLEKLHKVFKEKGLKLSVAESCTGGLISHYITALPGASLFFEGGAVTYSASLKEKILGVKAQTIAKYGVISKETASEMAEGVQRLTGSDYALATTGNLGPDVLENKDKGLVYLAVRALDKTYTRELKLLGERGENKERAAIEALKFLIEIINPQLLLRHQEV